MREPVAKQAFRTAVRGFCFSFIMPWEDIVRSVDDAVSDKDLAELPKGPEHLKYLCRLHLKVGSVDCAQYLKEVKLRPFVLVLLLRELIERRHGPFADNPRAQKLRERMERQVAERYPEQEPNIPDAEKEGTIPECLLDT